MKKIIFVLAFCFLASLAYADGYNIYTNENSAYDPGSYMNPIVIEDSKGNLVGEIKSKYPGQGGTSTNPYVYTPDERVDFHGFKVPKEFKGLLED